MIPDFDCSPAKGLLQEYHIRYKKRDFIKFDFVGVTTLFTFYWAKTIETINYAKMFCISDGQIMVGGIAATLQPEEIYKETGIHPYIGLLDKPGAIDLTTLIL